ncbi:hypothetical protein D9M69_607850 [compost metagenome]
MFFRPRLCTSVTNTSRPTIFMLLVMPNSFAALIALMVSPPALASASTCALEFCACSRKDEKSEVLSGAFTEPSTVPPFSFTTLVASASRAWPKA